MDLYNTSDNRLILAMAIGCSRDRSSRGETAQYLSKPLRDRIQQLLMILNATDWMEGTIQALTALVGFDSPFIADILEQLEKPPMKHTPTMQRWLVVGFEAMYGPTPSLKPYL